MSLCEQTTSRRDFLTRTLGTCLTASTLGAAPSTQSGPGALFDIQRVAKGVYAAVAQSATIVNCNAVIFENSDHLVVVDTHSKGSAAQALMAQIRKEISQKPVQSIIITHHHFDHIQGISAYRRMFPKAEIISSTRTRDLIAQTATPRWQRSLEQATKALEDARIRMKTNTSAREKEHWLRIASDADSYLEEMREVSMTLPDSTFARERILKDRNLTLRLSWRGRAHTAGDVVIFCPERKLLVSGDMTHSHLPYFGDSYPKEWPGVLRSVCAPGIEHIIGGHGPVHEGTARALQMADYIEELTAAVSNGRQQGRPVEQMQKDLTPASLRSLASGGYGEYVATQMGQGFATMELLKPADLLAQVLTTNIAQIYSALDNN